MTSTENTLRTRQNMEVLDVWKNLHSQVNALTKKQIAVFPDTLKPKTQRDLEVEVNVDKSVESLNTLLEGRLANLEFVLRNDQELRKDQELRSPSGIPRPTKRMVEPERPVLRSMVGVKTIDERKEIEAENKKAMDEYEKNLAKFREQERLGSEREKREIAERGTAQVKFLPFQNAYQDVINTGSVVSLWNNIVRYYQKQGLARQSQEMVKVKVQDLSPNLEAMIYGLGQAVDVLFSTSKFSNTLGLKVLEFLRTQSLYQLIKTQVDTASFEIITVSAMETVFRNIFSSLSEERRDLLDEMSSRGDITSTPIRKIPKFSSDNFQQRIKAVAEELGIRISDIPASLLQKLSELNKEDFEKYVDSAIRNTESEKQKIIRREGFDDLFESVNVFAREVSRLKLRKDVIIPELLRIAQQNVELLEGDFKEELPIIEEEVELPLDPQEPNRRDYSDEDSYDEAMEDYSEKRADYLRAVMRNEQIQNDIELRHILRSADETQLRETIANEKRKITELTDEQNRLRSRIIDATERAEEAITDASTGEILLTEQLENYVENKVDAFLGRLQKTRGRGKSINSRGLAGLGRHYGADESESESEEDSDEESDEEDPLDYDDRRNDMYYSRPARRR